MPASGSLAVVRSTQLNPTSFATPMSRVPRISFVSLGCPKALVASERIVTRLRAEGYELAREHADADLAIVNTCGFLDSAKAESLAAIGAALAENGKVVVEWTLDPECEPEFVTIQWFEREGPPVTPPMQRSFGSKLLERTIMTELGGDVRLDFFPAGVECLLRLPLSAKIKVQQ